MSPYRATERTEKVRLQDRARILDVTRRLISKGGYRAAQVALIAREAGLATGTVYRHFPSKAELFSEVFRTVAQREVNVTADSAKGATAIERMEAGVRTFAERALANRRLAYALLAEPVDPAIEAERLTFRRAYRDVFAKILEDGIRTGELPRQNVQLAAAAVVGAIGEAMVGPLSVRGSPAAIRKLLPDLVRFCIRSVSNASSKEDRRVRTRNPQAA
ncbi:MAG: TetR/AcrR family transcriptional regulator [Myxococcaceae bacterium]